MRHYRPKEVRPTSVDVFNTPSGLGGSFTVSIIEDRGATCLVRVWYGRAGAYGWEPWKEWDGYTFETSREALTKPRKMPLVKREPSFYDS